MTYSPYYVYKIWQGATIEELSSIFACVFNSVKTCIIFTSSLAKWWSLWAVISGWQLVFNIENNLAFYSEICYDITRTRHSLIQHLHHSVTFPLPVTVSHDECCLAQGRHLSDTVNYKRMFPPILRCGCEWKNKTSFTLTDASGAGLLCQSFEWCCWWHSGVLVVCVLIAGWRNRRSCLCDNRKMTLVIIWCA